MKLIKILIIIVVASTFGNCSNSNEDSVPPYLYEFHLKFLDANKNNLLEETDQNLLINNFSLGAESEDSVEKIGLNFEYIEDELYLKVSAASVPGKRLKEIYFSVLSKEIFNDEEDHQIKTLWNWEDRLDNTVFEVYLDGDTLNPRTENQFQYFIVE